ncbi:MAG: hypothetical protein WA162_00005 [Thermodesulfobacteriota bacterium]
MQVANQEKLKTIIKESVKEVLEEELIKMRLMFFPEVSGKEMQDIVSRYEKPGRKPAHTEKIDV